MQHTVNIGLFQILSLATPTSTFLALLQKQAANALGLLLLLAASAVPAALWAQGQSLDQTIALFQQSYKLEAGGRYSDAVSELEKVKADSYAKNLRLGWLCYLSGDFGRAVSFYGRAVALNPGSVEARLGYVLPAAKLKQWKLVQDQYDAVLRIDPNNYKANYYRALMCYNSGDYAGADRYLSKLTALYPFDYDAVILSAWCLYQLRQTLKARNAFQMAKLIQPASASADEGLKKCQ